MREALNRHRCLWGEEEIRREARCRTKKEKKREKRAGSRLKRLDRSARAYSANPWREKRGKGAAWLYQRTRTIGKDCGLQQNRERKPIRFRIRRNGSTETVVALREGKKRKDRRGKFIFDEGEGIPGAKGGRGALCLLEEP